ncbi:HNH endonuclease [Bradyrhizobium sp. AZCC 1699]|uniref:HNH endonuclease n=1 Tax=Bradyrhizobium sp. AZCC 1699 TaxID=3117024 RepID=UPI002FF33467
MLTAEYLKQIVEYDPETGLFTRDGEIAGCLNADGYWRICIDGVDHLAHRLAVLFMTGQWPRFGVSHRNDDRADNRWSNLRSASPVQTARNRRASNKLGIKGVRMTPRGAFRASIYVNKRHLNLGTFTTAEAASEAYANAAVKYFGEFARAA